MTEKTKSANQLADGCQDVEQGLKYGRELHDYAVGRTVVRLISGLVPCFKTTGGSPLKPGIQGAKP